jgi:molybdate transport system substrate-binding protein
MHRRETLGIAAAMAIAGKTVAVRAAAPLLVFAAVYGTDAAVEPGVRIVDTFPRDSHPSIVYPIAGFTVLDEAR